MGDINDGNWKLVLTKPFQVKSLRFCCEDTFKIKCKPFRV